MGRTWKVEPQACQDLLKPMTSLAVGATVAHPNQFPKGFSIGRRDEPRNQYLGLVVTRPQENTFILGLNHFDSVDDGDNEDTPYMRGSFEMAYPEYAGHHRTAKSYLRKPPNT